MRRILCFAAVVLGACTQASPPEAPEDAETKATPDGEAKQDPPTTWTEVARTHLVLAKHTNEAKAARFVVVDIASRKLSPGTDIDAMPLENWPGHFGSVAAHGGGRRFVTQRPASSGVEAVVVDTESPIVAVALPADAAAMHMVGDAVFVGIDDSVYWIDLAQSPPKPELLLARSLAGGKAYDLFVRNGEWLFAIDDVVRPIYADTFRLKATGTPAHDEAFQLPGMINGTYSGGALETTGTDAGTLYLLGGYGIMDGNGQDLAALPVVEGKPKHDGELVLNSGVHADPPVLEEHVDRGTGKPVKLVAGTDFTPWGGVELVGGGDTRRVLLSAGTRGLLSVPLDFKPDTKAEVVFAEPTIDVEVDGTRVFVLNGTQLVELAWTLPKPTEVARVDLPDTFDRIVD
jgi:hypothetical protein